MKKNEKIEAYLAQKMTIKEHQSFKKLIQLDVNLKNQARVKGLELLVAEELALQKKAKEKDKLAKWRAGFKRRKLIRNLSFLAMAASFALLLMVGNHFRTKPESNLVFAENWQQTDFNTKAFLSIPIDTKELIGKWKTTIQEQNGTGISLHLELSLIHI